MQLRFIEHGRTFGPNPYKWSAMRKQRGLSWKEVFYWAAYGYPTPPEWMYPHWSTRGENL
jgi:hypothetical protein